MYCRYIDDCCIVTSTQSEMDECFRILNQQSQYIKLTRETPRDGWLAYLNIQLMLSNGVVRVKWYRKESSKNIIVHAASAHPTAVKRAVIRNMLKTATDVCSGEIERQGSLKQAFDILHSNGYQTKPRKTRRLLNVSSTVERSDKLLLWLPFISDRISAAIRKCLIRAQLHDDVVLVNIPNDNIKRQLIRNRLYDRTCVVENCTICPYGKIGDCVKTGVIYEIECSVFRESRIHQEFMSGQKTGILLADSGYRAENFILKPILRENRTPAEERFTTAQCRDRAIVERASGSLKKQFSSLHSELRYSPQRCGKIIVAACALGNLAIILKEEEFPDDPDDPVDGVESDEDDALYEEPDTAAGVSLQQRIIISLFCNVT
ncbi:hypothetical protein Y032_0005g2276 [Ancylostoma ceylanicum]|uniref:Uncharacterized protein n=2 Tax=Ancylostoma ceylanicum TaxID=53326 RepID=A0A016VQW6_9BILA|nr:hypothetical protein Y032_0005g2276 [Ancylostoma ceylanicum]